MNRRPRDEKMNEVENDEAITDLSLMICWLWRQDLLLQFIGDLTCIHERRVL